MTSHVPLELRRQIAKRAGHQCEYCHIAEGDTFLGLQVDHIIAEKHGGSTELANLALCCPFCNRYKGTDLGSLNGDGELIRFFNPRVDRWSEHFRFQDFRIFGVTEIGQVTERILKFNIEERVLEREAIAKPK